MSVACSECHGFTTASFWRKHTVRTFVWEAIGTSPGPVHHMCDRCINDLDRCEETSPIILATDFWKQLPEFLEYVHNDCIGPFVAVAKYAPTFHPHRPPHSSPLGLHTWQTKELCMFLPSLMRTLPFAPLKMRFMDSQLTLYVVICLLPMPARRTPRVARRTIPRELAKIIFSFVCGTKPDAKEIFLRCMKQRPYQFAPPYGHEIVFT